MSGLPNLIPLQSVPIAQQGDDGNLYVEFNWYLFLYNLWSNLIGSGSGASIPVSPSDLLDMVALNAATADIPEVYRKIGNLRALEAMSGDVTQADIQRVQRDIENLRTLEAVKVDSVGPTLRDLANALLLAAQQPAHDPKPQAQAPQTVAVGASPFIYTALRDGTLAISGGAVSDISIIRQVMTVETGMTAGLIPASRLDQIQITYSDAPTAVFLPS